MTTDSYELPEPVALVRRWEALDNSPLSIQIPPPLFHTMSDGDGLFTADQMLEYALLAVKAERERAARICEHLAENGYKGLKHPTATECAAAIRGA